MLKRILFGILVALGLALQACSPKSQNECGFVQNVYGERISWKGNLPVVMYLHENYPSEYVTAAVNAAEAWNRTAGKKVIEIRTDTKIGGTGGAAKDGMNVIYYYNSWETDRTNEQARTSVYWVGDQIRETDIRVNNKDFNYYWTQATAQDEVNIEALLIHEMGHVLGLKHKDRDASVMATYLASNTNRTQIAETDRDSLKCEY